MKTYMLPNQTDFLLIKKINWIVSLINRATSVKDGSDSLTFRR